MEDADCQDIRFAMPSSETTPDLSGALIVDKPAGVTSHDVVRRIRKRLNTRKVGHLGTLDPMATGVLPVTIGKATRLARFIPNSPKEYIGRIRLGQDTTTCDAEGEPIGEKRSVAIDRAQLDQAMASFVGTIDQVPPAYSAKKIEGVRAHRLARRGVDVQMQPASVTIESFQLVAFESPELDFRVICSGGTYIRSLARDLGERLATGGHLCVLRRTRSGPFTLDGSVAAENATEANIIPPERLLQHMARIEVDESSEEAVRHGRPVPCGNARLPEGSDVCIFNKRGTLIAVATRTGGWASPKVVLL
jgi:tRNA pseudouridine55 synthase